MKWAIVGVTMLIWNYISCQDIRFPTDEETSHVSGNQAAITDRIPVFAQGECPTDMLLYPGDGEKSTWVCDCRPTFLYFPLNDTCHQAYSRGPCAPGNYVVLPINESVPKCVKNPCTEEGEVKFKGVCYPLRTVGGPCAPDGVLGINETNFEIECVPLDIAPFIIIDAPHRSCPPGSRRIALGKCRKQI